jgi:hypothetical protein
MSTALDDFERALVNASGALHAEAELAHTTPSHGSASRTPSRWHLIRRARQLSIALQLGLALSTFSALAAGGTVAYLVLSANQTKTLAALECNVTHTSTAIINTITGNPIVDCALTWPSATAGRAAAPPLTAWGLANNTKTAVVQPTSWGAPARIGGEMWRRLPADWTVNLNVVELTDQLNDISTKLSGTPIGLSGGPPCTYAQRDEQIVRSLLTADGLSSWHIALSPTNPGEIVSTGCRLTIPNIDGAARTVQLLQAGATQNVHLPPKEQHNANDTAVTNRNLAALGRGVNRALATRCESVNGAAALWALKAHAAGLDPTSLAYYRTLNAAPDPVPSRLAFDYYTLVKQPASQRTGSCAHILVMRGGGGNLTVYAARIAP